MEFPPLDFDRIRTYPLRERPNKRLRSVVGALGGIAVATSLTQRQRCAALGWRTPQNIPFSLIGVISLDAERHQTLADAFILIRILWAQGLGERVPQLFENDDELLGLNVLLMRFPADSLQKIRELQSWTIRSLELIRERCP